MFEKLKQHWEDFKEDEPGRRFQDHYYERQKTRRNPFRRFLLMGLGALIIIGGVVLLAIPGPGILVIFIGAGMIAEESLFMARVLDRTEVRIRKMYAWSKRQWYNASTPVRVLLIAVTLLILAALAYGAFWWFFLR